MVRLTYAVLLVTSALAGARSSEPPSFSFHELYNLTTTFYDNFMYPQNLIQARMINSTMLADDIIGRVDATRDIKGRELNTEYTFGLWANIGLNPGAFTLLGIPQSYNITHFTANQNIVSVSAIVNFNITAFDLVTPVEFLLWATFNRDREITQYDATFRYLAWEFSYLDQLGQFLLDVPTTAQVQDYFATKLAESICNTTQTYCNGTSQQYDSVDSCQNFLTNDIRFGQSFELGMNTLLCRMVHQNMIPSRPSVHCPHVGPSGGDMCNDNRTYTATVLEPLYLNQPFVPYGYQNKNKTIAEI